MIVLHLISSGGLYGAEAVILNLSRCLHAGGKHKSIVAAFANEGVMNDQLENAARKAGVEVHTLPCRGQVDRRLSGLLQALVERTGADVVHAHGYKADVYAALSLRGTRRPRLISTCHTWYDNDFAVRLYGALDRFVLRGFDAVVAVSEEVRARLLRSGVRAQRIHIIRNGVDLAPFAAAGRKRAVRSASPHSSAPHTLNFGLVGRLAPEKGVDIFLRAARELQRSHPSAASLARFTVVGEGPQRPELETLRSELGLQDIVDLQGRCDDMPHWYAAQDVLVSSSRQEGLPVALLEGMASGLPLIATPVGEVPQLAREGRTALLVPPDDPSALAQAMYRMLDEPPLREQMGAAGQQLIAAEYSAEAMTAEYLALYAGQPDPAGENGYAGYSAGQA